MKDNQVELFNAATYLFEAGKLLNSISHPLADKILEQAGMIVKDIVIIDENETEEIKKYEEKIKQQICS